MTNLGAVLTSLFCCLAVYLFVTAPPELPDVKTSIEVQSRAIDVSNMFNAVNAIHDAARHIYTSRIVGAGLEAGLYFGEDWAEPSVDKGPLPAQFTRLVAGRMETKPAPLGLYLGSDEPINKSNLFKGSQAIAFDQIKNSLSSVLFESDDAGYIAMYPDVASAKACVVCHNEHSDSLKNDWKMNDVMGATTWTYPKNTLGLAEFHEVIAAFYSSVQEAYHAFLQKAAGFKGSVVITDAWPEEGKMILPDTVTFITAVQSESAVEVLNALVLNSSPEFDSLDPMVIK